MRACVCVCVLDVENELNVLQTFLFINHIS